jgi:predicted DNA-binding protein with PD1-like motif
MLTPLALRLHPGQDLKAELDNLAKSRSIEAACIVTCAGSLTKAVLRYANQEQAVELDGYFEILSLTGTLSKYGSHFHIAIADGTGRTIGAHLLEGCRVYTTAEIVIGILAEVSFFRTVDGRTGYPELEIAHREP